MVKTTIPEKEGNGLLERCSYTDFMEGCVKV